MKNAAIMYLITGITALFGLLAGLLFFSELYSRYKITKYGIETNGTVVEVKYKTEKNVRLAAPVIMYKTATGTTEVYDSDMYTNLIKYEEGETIKISYDPDDPKKILLGKGGWLTISLYFSFFGVFSTFGFWGLWWVDWYRRRDNWLDKNGKVIQALYWGTKATMGQYRVLCEWKDPTTEQLYLFMGDWNTGIEANSIPSGTLIPVLVNIDHPERCYRVDVSQWSPAART